MSRPQGDQLFVNWFADLTSRGSTIEVPKYPNQVFIPSENIRVIHDVLLVSVAPLAHSYFCAQILNIYKTYGVDYKAFFNLMQRTAEELKYMDLDDEDLDDLVPVSVVKLFAKDFIDGFINYMLELGFETDMDIL